MFGPEYPKIQTAFKRDERSHVIIPGDWSTPELAYLADRPWLWTEKVDGTNIRLHWQNNVLAVGGRTNDASIPTFLIAIIQSWQLETKLREHFLDVTVTLYGEGYGPKIGSGGQYRTDPSFTLFDVAVKDREGNWLWWLSRNNVFNVGAKLGLDIIPDMGIFSLVEAVDYIRNDKLVSFWPKARIEGLVGRPEVNLFDHHGDRIMVKIKGKDFRDLERRQGSE